MNTQNNNNNVESSIQHETQAPENLQSQPKKTQETPEPELSLIVYDKASKVETRHVLKEGEEVIVGALPECSVVVSDEYMSGRHFSIKVQDGKAVVTDLASTNGLYLRLEGSVEVLLGQKLLAGKTIVSLEGAGDELAE